MTSDRKEKRDSSYTIMIFKGGGKVKGLKISSGIVFWLALLLIFYFIASGAIIWEYMENRSETREYLGELDGLRSQTGKMRKELFRARENIKMLEEHVYNMDGEEKKKGTVETVPEKKPAPVKELDKPAPKKEEKKEISPEKESGQVEKAEDEEITEGRVEVKNLNFHGEGEKLLVTFNLLNKKQNNEPVSGYVHMLASFSDSPSSRMLTYPGVKLKDGMPVWYKAGYFFRIARFMPLKGEFKLASAEDMPSSLKVLVYDKDGTLIFEEEYEIALTE